MVHCDEVTGQGLQIRRRPAVRSGSAQAQTGGLLLQEALVRRVDGRLQRSVGCDAIVGRLRISRIGVKAAARSATTRGNSAPQITAGDERRDDAHRSDKLVASRLAVSQRLVRRIVAEVEQRLGQILDEVGGRIKALADDEGLYTSQLRCWALGRPMLLPRELRGLAQVTTSK